MEGRKESQVSWKRPRRVGAVALLVLGAALALALVSASSGSTRSKQATAAKPSAVISTGKGFGEVYAARRRRSHTLFKATLLPKDRMSRNIALAGLGRADRKVNEALALRCWKNNGCTTGTKGKLTVAYIEQFGENVYRQMSKMEFILQALTYPEVGRIIYSSAHSDFTKAFADWRAAIAQGVDLIVTYPDFGDAMIPVMKQATDAGIPVATYAWGYVSDPGKNYLTVVGEDTCARQDVRVRHEQPGQVRRDRLPRRLPGNPLRGLAEVRRARAPDRRSTSSRRSRRTGIRRRCSRSWPGSSRRIPTSRAGATSTGSAWARAATRRTRPQGSRSTAS